MGQSLSRMISWLMAWIFPRWVSHKLEALKDAKTPDFLEKYYQDLDETDARE